MNKPDIRFNGFDGEWTEKKLEDIYGTISNAFVGTATPYYVERGHFYLESNNVKNGYINKNSQVFINDDFYQRQKQKWLCTDDIVMVQSGHVGHSALIPEDSEGINAMNETQILRYPNLSDVSDKLSWSHICELIKIDDELERKFYQTETLNAHWDIRSLRRQMNSSLYLRLAASSDKKGIEEFQKILRG